jgi:adenosylcobinamide-GDP ribazoletransferase
MRWIKAVALAFSTYTRIPMPQGSWDGGAQKISLAFLPLVGAAVGGAVWSWQFFCGYFHIGAALFAAIAVALPVWITGGIHMDGFCDTQDALASWQDKERRLEILKDPHAGAFAVIRFGVYLLVGFAVLTELFTRGYDGGICFVFVLSRCFAAWNALTMPNARADGMLAAFTKKADRGAAYVILALFTAFGLAGLIWLNFPYGLTGLALCLPVTVWYRRTAKKRFGGATGDTTGYYLQITELTLLTGLLLGGIVWHGFF